ncbi:hypothetical protein Pfo_031426 [Paulownia fortunei]|nr:hypothetical protein Pfo_031426 [Paulownia fortunei]
MLRIQQPTPNQKCIASMASDGGNKAKREGMYVYNIVADVPPTSVKNVISKGWGTLMRSKTYRESSGTEKMVAEWGGEVVESRKSGRRSVSEVEANVGSVAAFLQVKVLVSDMPGFMQVHAFRCATTTYDSLDKFSSKRMAHNMKKEFDKVYGPAWHCIVGSSFGSFVTRSTGCFLYFSMEKVYILVFKTKVQRALDQI